jgi:hypothetical protein
MEEIGIAHLVSLRGSMRDYFGTRPFTALAQPVSDDEWIIIGIPNSF